MYQVKSYLCIGMSLYIYSGLHTYYTVVKTNMTNKAEVNMTMRLEYGAENQDTEMYTTRNRYMVYSRIIQYFRFTSDI